MSSFRSLFTLLVFCFLLIGQANALDKTNKAFKNFWHPIYLGERLDYCSLNGQECGKPVADHYCRMMGYTYSSQYDIAHNVGLTHFISTRAECKGWRCNGFINITCVTDLSHTPPQAYYYREKEFFYPRYDDYRVAWCYADQKGCGKKSADSFCSRIGYMRAKHFEKEKQIGATKTLGNQELCFGNQCDAFKLITCYR